MKEDKKCITVEGFSMSFGSDGIWLHTPILNGNQHSINLKSDLIGPRKVFSHMAQDFMKEVNKRKE